MASIRFVSPESFATMFELEPDQVKTMIKRGDLRAIRIGETYRIAESELSAFVQRHSSKPDGLCAEDDWQCPTLERKKDLRVRGKDRHYVVWDPNGLNRTEFSSDFVAATLEHFRGQEVRCAMGFAMNETGTLGAWFRQHYPRGSNATFMLASILVHLGYATRERRGYIRFKETYPDEAGRQNPTDREDRLQAIRELQEYRKRLSLGGLNVRDLIEEGRM